jgi:ferric-dicitrate binding protein FerR (iron transport regulator)
MNEEIKALVIRYITGNADAAEQEYVRQWIAESQANMDNYILLRETWQDALLHPGHRVFDGNAAFERLRQRVSAGQAEEDRPAEAGWPVGSVRSTEIAGQVEIKRPMPEPGEAKAGGDRSPGRLFFMRLRTAVAVVLLLIAGGAFIGLYLRRSAAPIQAGLQLFVPNGKMKRLMLPDSTVVCLNAGTRFSYAAGFGQTNREITLEGEGYFSVRHNESLPFVVKAGGYRIRDVGTIFTVIAYPGNKTFETAVMEGKVEVTSDPKIKGVLLSRNEVLKVSMRGPARDTADGMAAGDRPAIRNPAIDAQLEIVTEPHIEKYASWKDNILVFEEESFEEVARRLERTFNVHIRINSDRLAALKYTGRFTRVPTIAEALRIIHETTPILYATEGDTVTISLEKR